MSYIILNSKTDMIYSRQITSDIFHFVRSISESKKFHTIKEAETIKSKMKNKKEYNNLIIERVK